jgi:hypothetical protein
MPRTPKQYKIDGLTERQVGLLDIIYTCDTYDELVYFTRRQPPEIREEIWVLTQLLLHESIEEDIIKPMTSYPDAERIMNKIMSK